MTKNMKYIIDQDNNIYRTALRRETEVWQENKGSKGHKSIIEKETNSARVGEEDPILLSYANSKIGIESTSEFGWVDFIVTKFKKVDNALSLGSGSGRVEEAFIKRGFVKQFDTIDIIQKNHLNDGVNDLNFISLPNNKYDFILCKAILHHIINLEHLLFQVNKALTNDGIIVVKEFCGESSGQWSDKKINILNRKIKDKFGQKYPFLKIQKSPMWNSSPFEGIRSSEIHPIIKKYFGNNTEFEVTYNGAAYPIMLNLFYIASYKSRYYNSFLYNLVFLHHKILQKIFMQEIKLINNAKIVNEILEFAVELDRKLTNHKSIIPCALFGVYRKSNIIAPIPAKPWTAKEIRYQLNLNLPIYRKIILRYKRFMGK